VSSIYPADVAKRAAITWRHSATETCPTCHGPSLIGFLDGKETARACHRCGDDSPMKKAALYLASEYGNGRIH